MSILKAVCLMTFVYGCGTYEDDDYKKNPPPNPESPGPENPDQDLFAQILPLVKSECGRCHNGIVRSTKYDTEQAFRSAKARVVNGSMPPDRPLGADVKAKFVDFLNN